MKLDDRSQGSICSISRLGWDGMGPFADFVKNVINDSGPGHHYLNPNNQLMSGHQLIKLLRLTRLAVMSATHSVSCDPKSDQACNRCHMSGLIQTFCKRNTFVDSTSGFRVDIDSELSGPVLHLYPVESTSQSPMRWEKIMIGKSSLIDHC
jgi:hypothetical protein